MTARAMLLLVLALIVGVTWVFAVVSKRFEKGELLRRTLALLDSLTPETLANTLRFT